MSVPANAVALLLLVALAACDDGEAKRKAEQAEEAKREAGLFANQQTAAPELDRRLADKLSVSDSALIFEDQGEDIDAVPTTATWLISCGIAGLSIGFPQARSSDNDDMLEVALTDTWLTRDQCKWLAPLLTAKLSTLLRQR